MGVGGERFGGARGGEESVHGFEGGADGRARRAAGDVPAAQTFEVGEEG